MTHALHRCGSIESLKGDYVLLAINRGADRAHLAPGLSKIAEIMLEVEPTNAGSSELAMNLALGFDREEFVRRITEGKGVACSFSSKEKLKEALVKLKEADLGISLTVAGITEEVMSLARELGLTPHTINISFGIIGATEKLQKPEVLDLITMCGHGRVGPGLAKKALDDVASGEAAPKAAARMLGQPCTCGIFNLDRAEQLLSAASSK